MLPRGNARATGLAALAILVLPAIVTAGCGGGATHRDPRPPIIATPDVGGKSVPTPSRGAMERAIDTVYRGHQQDIVGACMGAIVERTAVTRCYGSAARGSTERPTPQTLFQVGSIAKTMTATLLALRVQDGSVKLGDPLARYIPKSHGAAAIPPSLTLLLLADHHSGLPRTTPIDTVSSLDRYLGLVGRCEAAPGCTVAPPGERYLYSNFAYGALGEALAKHDGYRESSYSGWEKDMRANVTDPLGMPDTRSWFGWRATSAAEFDRRRARALVGEPPKEPDPPYYPPAPYGDAAAGLYSTAADILRWLSYSMGLTGTARLEAARPLLYDTPALIRPRTAGDPRKAIGLAWDVDTYPGAASPATCISKDGAARGFSANMIFIPQERRGAFVMLNSRPEAFTTPQLASELINALPAPPGSRQAPGRCGVFAP